MGAALAVGHPRFVRPASGVARRSRSGHRDGRGRAGRCLGACADRLGRRRHAGESRRRGCTRWPEIDCATTGNQRRTGDAFPSTRRSSALESHRTPMPSIPRSPARTDAGLCAPGDRAVDPHAVDAAGGARGRCRGDRGGVRRGTRDDGAAAGARQEAHPRHRNSLRRARTRTPRPTAARGPGSGLRRVRDRLAGRARWTTERVAGRRGAPPGDGAGGTPAGRARGAGVGGADVSVGGEAGGAQGRRRTFRSAGRAGRRRGGIAA